MRKYSIIHLLFWNRCFYLGHCLTLLSDGGPDATQRGFVNENYLILPLEVHLFLHHYLVLFWLDLDPDNFNHTLITFWLVILNCH